MSVETYINQRTIFQASFGPTHGGLTDVGYTLKNEDNTVFQPRTQMGVVDDGGGYYHVGLKFTSARTGIIAWDTSSVPAVHPQDVFTVLSQFYPSQIGGPSPQDIFRTIVDGDVIEQWARQTLMDWFPVYLREIALQRGEPEDLYPLPRSYIVANDLEKEAADQLPAIVLVSPGLNGQPPKAEGDGTYRATWVMAVGAFASGNTREATKKLVRLYTAVIRAIMVQKPSLGGHTMATIWLDESYDDDFTFTDDQTISVGQVIFDVTVEGVVTRTAGPTAPPDPDTQPGQEWHTANEVIIELRKEPLLA